MGKNRNAHRVLVGKPGGKKLLGRPGHCWKNNNHYLIYYMQYNFTLPSIQPYCAQYTGMAMYFASVCAA